MNDAESKVFGKYLQDPNQIKFALENLEKNSNLALSFEERYVAFERDLKIESGGWTPDNRNPFSWTNHQSKSSRIWLE